MEEEEEQASEWRTKDDEFCLERVDKKGCWEGHLQALQALQALPGRLWPREAYQCMDWDDRSTPSAVGLIFDFDFPFAFAFCSLVSQ